MTTVECSVINCHRPATGTATDPNGPADVCEPCGIHFWGNFTSFPSAVLF